MNWHDLLPNSEQQALFLIRSAAWIVPSKIRAHWRREWVTELHFAVRTMRERGDGLAVDAKAIEFAKGAFHDAVWHRLCDWNRERLYRALSRVSQSAGFCLAAICTVLLAITIASGFLPETRDALMPLPYPEAHGIATVAQGGTRLSVRSAIRREWIQWWREDSRLIDGAATYLWSTQSVDGVQTIQAKVSPDFFSVLLRAEDPFRNCRDCAVLSSDFARRVYGAQAPAKVVIAGEEMRVASILDRRFWFLTRRIGVWVIEGSVENRNAKTGVIVRLRPDVSEAQVQAELARFCGSEAWIRGQAWWNSRSSQFAFGRFSVPLRSR